MTLQITGQAMAPGMCIDQAILQLPQLTGGNATDLPVPLDHDGDGKDDVAVFRKGTWYILRWTGGAIVTNWGVTGDISIPSKYIP